MLVAITPIWLVRVVASAASAPAVITSSTGYKGRLQDAAIDVKKGVVRSELPVVVDMLNGTLNANNLVVSDSGDTILFGGGVVMNMTMQPPKPAEQKASE